MSLPLPQRMQMQPAVAADPLAVGGDDFPGLVGHEGPQEIGHPDFADEADPLAVFFRSGGQSEAAGGLAHVGLGHPPDREAGRGDLGRPQQGQEVTLVLVAVAAPQEAGLFALAPPPRVVAGGHRLEALGPRKFEEHPELHLPVAHRVGIGGDPLRVAAQQVSDDPLAVFAHEVDHPEPDADLVGDPPGVLDVLLPRAMAGDVLLVDPVLHVGAGDLVPLLLEQGRGHAAVHAAGQAHQDLRHD